MGIGLHSCPFFRQRRAVKVFNNTDVLINLRPIYNTFKPSSQISDKPHNTALQMWYKSGANNYKTITNLYKTPTNSHKLRLDTDNLFAKQIQIPINSQMHRDIPPRIGGTFFMSVANKKPRGVDIIPLKVYIIP